MDQHRFKGKSLVEILRYCLTDEDWLLGVSIINIEIALPFLFYVVNKPN